jgi:alpha-glucosidase
VVARRRDLPDLRAQLRRRRRRRRRRPARGARSRLPYLRELGFDAVWLNPFYPSPQADAGYDVSDHRAVDPRFGTLAEVDGLIADAHRLGRRVLIDLVPNHTSSRPPLVQGRARRRTRQSGAGEVPVQGRPRARRRRAAQRLVEPVRRLGVGEGHRGVDGFRIDVAHGLAKDPEMPDLAGRYEPWTKAVGHPHWDLDEVHDVYRAWRRVGDGYLGDRCFVAEAWVQSPARLARYLRPDELHTAFSPDLLEAPWDARAIRKAIVTSMAELAKVGAPCTWVLSNHDVTREVTRYGGGRLGILRATAAALPMLALPGGAYVDQGEELGLPEVLELPGEVRQDPVFVLSGGAEVGRDGPRRRRPGVARRRPGGTRVPARAGLRLRSQLRRRARRPARGAGAPAVVRTPGQRAARGGWPDPGRDRGLVRDGVTSMSDWRWTGTIAPATARPWTSGTTTRATALPSRFRTA